MRRVCWTLRRSMECALSTFSFVVVYIALLDSLHRRHPLNLTLTWFHRIRLFIELQTGIGCLANSINNTFLHNCSVARAQQNNKWIVKCLKRWITNMRRKYTRQQIIRGNAIGRWYHNSLRLKCDVSAWQPGNRIKGIAQLHWIN